MKFVSVFLILMLAITLFPSPFTVAERAFLVLILFLYWPGSDR